MSGACSKCGKMWSFCTCRNEEWKPKIVHGIKPSILANQRHYQKHAKPAVLVEDLPKLLEEYIDWEVIRNGKLALYDKNTSQFLRLKGFSEAKK